MVTIISGIALLLITLAAFSLFSLKMPKGQAAMSGMANAAVATFLVEAIMSYIAGDLFGISFFKDVGSIAGGMGGVAAAALVPMGMGASPVLSMCAGVAVGGYGILPGFIAGYVVGLIGPAIEKKLPEGLDVIVGALAVASVARAIAAFVNPGVTMVLSIIGKTITIPSGRNYQDDLYLSTEFHGSYRYAGTDRTSDGNCRRGLLRRILHQRNDFQKTSLRK